ncbi:MULTISPECIES: MarR family winged helix-turn-helix transcriptional regulator [Bacteria]
MPALRGTAAPSTSPGPERLWETTVGGDISFLLARANAISLATTNEALAMHGLKVRSYSVLGVAASDARPTQRELSEFLRLDPSQIVSIIDELETRGLVRREPDPNDRRVNVVVVTPEGREKFAAARVVAQKSELDMLALLDSTEIAALAEALNALATAVPPEA